MTGGRRSRYRWAALAIALMLAWPFVHYAFTRHYEMNYWRFGGMAMYAGSGPTSGFALYDETDGRRRLKMETLPTDAVDLVRERLRLRHELGLLYPVRRVVEPILDAMPDIQAIGLEERIGYLEAVSGIYRHKIRRSTCRRNGECRRSY